MDFEQALRERAAAVEAYIEGELSRRPSPARRLLEAMRYAVTGGGKALRPFLVIESAALFGVPGELALPAAAALECVHCYSLVHDDLPAMDDDDTRRGRPSAHVAFDEATAILAGDALLTFAFELLAEEKMTPDLSTRLRLVLALAKAAGAEGMAGGQSLDMTVGAVKSGADVLTLQAMKTGALFSFALEAGALLGKAGKDETSALSTYAAKTGLAFQIADDLLDRTAAAETAGKRTGKDRNRGKVTFVDLEGLDGARSHVERLVGEAIAALGLFGEKAVLLRQAAHFVLARAK